MPFVMEIMKYPSNMYTIDKSSAMDTKKIFWDGLIEIFKTKLLQIGRIFYTSLKTINIYAKILNKCIV